MTSRRLASYVASGEPVLRLPHPYLTPYFVHNGGISGMFQLKAGESKTPSTVASSASSVFFTEPEYLKSGDRPDKSNNTAWARARRSPLVTIRWTQNQDSLVAAVWLVVYTIFAIRPGEEFFRLKLNGPDAAAIATHLKAVALGIDHPRRYPDGSNTTAEHPNKLVVPRASFWQGAGSPFGPRPVWLPEDPTLKPEHRTSSFPLTPLDYTMTINPASATHSWHPQRPVKPHPGSVLYSRYIPHLNETFSMVALDHTDAEHLRLFHQWQNDPRVSQGWNQTGTLEQHREYLRRVHEDPHQLSIMARFDGAWFAYFEVYWAKEDRLGGYYTPGDFDRGRYSLVGDVRYRGPHRVSTWWSSLMHYLFLDDPRTACVVGEPKLTNSSVLIYDLMHGFGVDKFVDLPEKRAAFMRCSRERFFQLCPLDENGRFVAGTMVGLVPKL